MLFSASDSEIRTGVVAVFCDASRRFCAFSCWPRLLAGRPLGEKKKPLHAPSGALPLDPLPFEGLKGAGSVVGFVAEPELTAVVSVARFGTAGGGVGGGHGRIEPRPRCVSVVLDTSSSATTRAGLRKWDRIETLVFHCWQS